MYARNSCLVLIQLSFGVKHAFINSLVPWKPNVKLLKSFSIDILSISWNLSPEEPISSVTSFVESGNKQLHEPMLTNFSVAIWRLQDTMSQTVTRVRHVEFLSITKPYTGIGCNVDINAITITIMLIIVSVFYDVYSIIVSPLSTSSSLS